MPWRKAFFQGNWKEVFILKERITKKILAIFLTIAMCLTLMPVTAFAYTEGDILGTTGSGTEESDPVICDTFADFKAAMEDTEILFIKLTGMDEVIPGKSELSAAIIQSTDKTLIEGENVLTAPLGGQNDCLIWSKSDLILKGNGTLQYDHGNRGDMVQ